MYLILRNLSYFNETGLFTIIANAIVLVIALISIAHKNCMFSTCNIPFITFISDSWEEMIVTITIIFVLGKLPLVKRKTFKKIKSQYLLGDFTTHFFQQTFEAFVKDVLNTCFPAKNAHSFGKHRVSLFWYTGEKYGDYYVLLCREGKPLKKVGRPNNYVFKADDGCIIHTIMTTNLNELVDRNDAHHEELFKKAHKFRKKYSMTFEPTFMLGTKIVKNDEIGEHGVLFLEWEKQPKGMTNMNSAIKRRMNKVVKKTKFSHISELLQILHETRKSQLASRP